MAIQDSDKFHVVSADVDTIDRGSASANSNRSIFTWSELKAAIPHASGITGSGTANKLARFTGTEVLGDSLIGDDGTTVSLGVDITIGDSIKFSEDGTSKFGFIAGQDNFFIYNEGSLQFECNSTTTTLYYSGGYKLYTTTNGVKVNGQMNLQALNTAPVSATDTGALGEIRWAADYMYLCTATNTWVRTPLATW